MSQNQNGISIRFWSQLEPIFFLLNRLPGAERDLVAAVVRLHALLGRSLGATAPPNHEQEKWGAPFFLMDRENMGKRSTYCPHPCNSLSISYPQITHLHNWSTIAPNIPPQIINKSAFSLIFSHQEINLLSSNLHLVGACLNKKLHNLKLDVVYQQSLNNYPTYLTVCNLGLWPLFSTGWHNKLWTGKRKMGWLSEQTCTAHSVRFLISCLKLIPSPGVERELASLTMQAPTTYVQNLQS